jgi:sulfite dehydrogenase
MDYGAGIKRVEFSSDGGRSWTETTLDPDLGRYSWRCWRIRWLPSSAYTAAWSGPQTMRVSASCITCGTAAATTAA